jgi:hypothetical protein
MLPCILHINMFIFDMTLLLTSGTPGTRVEQVLHFVFLVILSYYLSNNIHSFTNR